MKRTSVVLCILFTASCSSGGSSDESASEASKSSGPERVGSSGAAAPAGKAASSGCDSYLPAMRSAGFANPRVQSSKPCMYEYGSGHNHVIAIHPGMPADYDAAESAPKAVSGVGARAERIDQGFTGEWLYAWRADEAVIGVQWVKDGAGDFPAKEVAALAKALLPTLKAPPPEKVYTEQDFAKDGFCAIEVTGGATDEARVPGFGAMTIATTHWYGENAGSDRFMLNCGRSSGQPFFFTFRIANGTTDKQFPYGPGTYQMAKSPKAGQIGRAGWASRYRGVSVKSRGPETFTIERFDDTGIAGGFEIPATVKPHGVPVEVIIKGHFELPCTGTKCRKG